MTKKIHYVCKYAPVELLEGFGAEVLRLDPAPVNFDCADACSHPNLCGYGKAVIEAVEAKDVEALILTDCCDVMRRVYDILKEEGKIPFLHLMALPHKSGRAEVQWLARELEEVKEAWQAYSGESFNTELALKQWRAGIQEAEAKKVKGPHIALSGAHGGGQLIEAAEKRFSIPVVDETCTGNRELKAPEGVEDFLLDYAHALLRQETPCMRMYDLDGRGPSENTTGTIYHTVKFCDYYSFEYADIKGDEGAPLLKIETDCTPQSSGQLSTRFDAFAETLGIGKRNKMTGEGNYVAGVDSGSTSTDAVVMDREGNILGSAILPTGSGAAAGAKEALREALNEAGVHEEELASVVTTGYGRETIGLSDDSVTEITCHARGAQYLYPEARTVIDIGGQDSKVIHIDEDGNVKNFIMNDKCAAGTGRFLDMMAKTLNLTFKEMSGKGLEWKNDVVISSMCTVFAESEVVSLVAENTAPEDIIHGLNKAVAGKTASLVKRLKGQPAYIMTGGVAQNEGVVRAMEEKLGAPVHVDERAQLCGAIGAALIAAEACA